MSVVGVGLVLLTCKGAASGAPTLHERDSDISLDMCQADRNLARYIDDAGSFSLTPIRLLDYNVTEFITFFGLLTF
jgi:hypothetical protein